MRRSLLLATAALAVGVFSGAARADSDQDFTLVNRTGYQIDEVYVSPSSSNRWGRDVMGRDVLEDGDTVDITFPSGTRGCNWDLKVVYSDHETATWSNVNLCSISRVTLRYNRRAGTTSAITE